MPQEKLTVDVEIYLDDGTKTVFEVKNGSKAREIASEIIKDGLRRAESTKDESDVWDGDVLTWYPPHRIKKIKLVGPRDSLNINYRPKA